MSRCAGEMMEVQSGRLQGWEMPRYGNSLEKELVFSSPKHEG